MFYFAYGSNILRSRLENQKRRKRRIGQVIDHGTGVLFGYTIKFNKTSIDRSGKTNIVKSDDLKVLGVIYELTDEQINLLEEIEVGYKRSPVDIVLESNTIRADTFFANPEKVKDGLFPTRDYLNFLILGAKEHDFSEDYIEFLEKTEVK
ncbi:MAG: gamma-glutamylcyclotransferase family protein [Candidatus Jorgensenbacteria bacterium]